MSGRELRAWQVYFQVRAEKAKQQEEEREFTGGDTTEKPWGEF